jgi:CheY-like chemotaxis protein
MVALKMLEKQGYHADAVANGAEALAALRNVPYELVLMDVQMPEMDGFEATRHIRSPESSVLDHQVPIIAMTAHAMKGDRERCLEMGMNDYISKPVSPQALAAALEKWLMIERKVPSSVAAVEEAVRTAGEETQDEETLVFDRKGMIARLMDNEDLARSVAMTFLEDIPKQFAALSGFLEANDAEGIERQVHSIKGASANVGGEALRRSAFILEKAAAAGDLEFVSAGIPNLENQFAELREAMTEFAEGRLNEESASQ